MMKRRTTGAIYSYKRRRIGGIGPYGLAGSAVAGLGSMAMQLYRGGSRVGRMVATQGRGGSSGIGVTNQYDRTGVYRKKRMPRRKRRQWRKFVKKVNAVTEKDYGTNTIVRNNVGFGQATPGLQGLLTVSLYGKDGIDTATSFGNSDLKDIYGNDLNTLASTKFKFCSAILDMTCVNNSTSEETNANLGLEVDVYEITYRKVASSTSPTVALSSNNASLINPGNAGLTINTRGVTPFDLPDPLSRYGITIYKKTKFFIGKGQQFTYQMRNPKSYSWQKDFIDDGNDDFMIPYVTKTLVIVYKGLPDPLNSVTPVLNIGVTRKYMYKEMDVSNDADNLI